MKFSLKLLLSTMIVMALALGFSGFYFVNYVFNTSLERETSQAIDENSILRFAFETAVLNVPVKYIGVGEKIDDLQKFNADDFVNALFDIEEVKPIFTDHDELI